MKLKFLGANRQVTGSRYHLRADGASLLVDCGMFQERPFQDRNWIPFPGKPKELDALVLTHAHLDHCGLIPRLVHNGFRGPIFATPATIDLAEIILRDSAHIQSEDVAYKKRRHKKEGRKPKHPAKTLYDLDDVEQTLELFEPIPYADPVAINDHAKLTLHDAGHILGSSIVDLEVQENGKARRILFTGDLGQWNKPLLRDPAVLESADFIVMESTYGDSDHPAHVAIEEQLATVLNETLGGGGSVVIPTFAVERAQELMYLLSQLVHDDRIPDVPILLDSPMAVNATDVFRRHRDCFDNETWERISSGDLPLRFAGLRLVRSVEESKAINDLPSPMIIMSSSGMCTAGRIKFHLRRYIGRPDSAILFVGFQVPGTLGQQILSGKSPVRIHGREWKVRARIERIHGFSGHADRNALFQWLSHFKSPPQQLFLTHGEESKSLALAKQIEETLGWSVRVPEYQESIALNCSP